MLRFVAPLLVGIACAFVPGGADADARTHALYVAVGGSVEILNASTGASIGTITPPTGRIHGLAVGRNGDVYISTFDFARATTTIYQYGAGRSKPSFSYSIAAPADGPIAVSDTGQIAFAVFCAGEGGCSGGSTPIIFFANHVARAIGRVTVSNGFISGLTYGPGGTLWVGSHPEKGVISYLTAGASSFVPVRLDTALRPISYFPVDEHGDVLSLDPLGAVNVFGGHSGRLFHRVAIGGIFERFVDMALGERSGLLYVATNDHILAYRYPVGGIPIATFSVGPISAIALDPD